MLHVTRQSLIADARDAKALAIEQRDIKALQQASDLLRQLGDDTFTDQEQAEIELIAELDCVPTALYRHFDLADNLLYIGISMTITGRTAQHETYAPWFQEIAIIKVEWHASRSAAARAEKLAIKAENPKYNVIHNKAHNNAAQKPKARVVRSGTGKGRKRKPSL